MVDYCTVGDVKPVLHIDATEVSEDAELTDCVQDASVKVRSLLKAQALEVPSDVPDDVKIAAKNFAAWLYRRRRDPEALKRRKGLLDVLARVDGAQAREDVERIL